MASADRAMASAESIGHLLAHFTLAPGQTVAAYDSFGTEPSTVELRDELRARGARVLLPVLLSDKDLSWMDEYGEDLGPASIAASALVVVPGLAGDLHGHRLGRGGGSYDRALARVPVGVPRALLLFRGEVLETVPAEPHDAAVTHLVTPDGVAATSAWLGR